MRPFLRDLGVSLRRLLHQPKYLTIAVVTLAVGIGANAAIFSVLKTVVLEPLPYSQPDELALVWSANVEEGWDQTTLSYPDYLDWVEQQSSFESLSAFAYTEATLTGIENPHRVTGAYVSSDLLGQLGVEPAQGRLFEASSRRSSEPRVVVISDSLWRESFGADPSVVGEAIQVNGEPLTVIGVMPPDFTFPPRLSFQSNPLPYPTELWLPVESWAQEFGRGSRLFFAVGRLDDGVGVERAESALDTIANRLADEYPGSNRGWSVDVESLHGHVIRPVRPALVVFSLAVLLILVLACANVANLLLAQSADRESEIAMRLALGSQRSDLMRERVAEGLLLALLSGVLGLVVAKVATELLIWMAAGQAPRMAGFELDLGVVVFTLGLTLLLGLLFGFLPMLQHSHVTVAQALRSGDLRSAGGSRMQRFRQAVVAVEAAIAAILLVSSVTLLMSYQQLESVEPGFDADDLLVAEVALVEARYPEATQILSFFGRAGDRIESLPGSESVAWVNVLPLRGNLVNSFQIPGRATSPGKELRANLRSVSSNYFETMGIPIVRGRVFDERDHGDAASVAVINETMARQFWRGSDPVGAQVVADPYPGSGRSALEVDSTARIMGVVGDVRHGGFEQDAAPTLYVPFSQDPNAQAGILVRTRTDPEAFAAPTRSAIWEIDPDVPLDSVTTMNQIMDESLGDRRFRAVLLSVFAIAALILAITGMYSIVSYAASRRAREIGIRMSMGAQRGEIVRGTVARGIVPVIVGLVAGVVFLVLLSQVAASLVAELAGLKPLVIAAGCLLVLGVAALANYFPARRLGRTNPVEVLRYE